MLRRSMVTVIITARTSSTLYWFLPFAYLCIPPPRWAACCSSCAVHIQKVSQTDALLNLDPSQPSLLSFLLDKAMAMGVIQSAIGLFGNVPCPIIYGAIVDSACLLWKSVCGKHGACSLYDADTFRHYFLGVYPDNLDCYISFVYIPLPPSPFRHYGWHYVSGLPHGSGRLAQGASHWYCAWSTGCGHSSCRCTTRCYHTARCVRIEATYSCTASGYDGLTVKNNNTTQLRTHHARFPINVYLNC